MKDMIREQLAVVHNKLLEVNRTRTRMRNESRPQHPMIIFYVNESLGDIKQSIDTMVDQLWLPYADSLTHVGIKFQEKSHRFYDIQDASGSSLEDDSVWKNIESLFRPRHAFGSLNKTVAYFVIRTTSLVDVDAYLEVMSQVQRFVHDVLEQRLSGVQPIVFLLLDNTMTEAQTDKSKKISRTLLSRSDLAGPTRQSWPSTIVLSTRRSDNAIVEWGEIGEIVGVLAILGNSGLSSITHNMVWRSGVCLTVGYQKLEKPYHGIARATVVSFIDRLSSLHLEMIETEERTKPASRGVDLKTKLVKLVRELFAQSINADSRTWLPLPTEDQFASFPLVDQILEHPADLSFADLDQLSGGSLTQYVSKLGTSIIATRAFEHWPLIAEFSQAIFANFNVTDLRRAHRDMGINAIEDTLQSVKLPLAPDEDSALEQAKKMIINQVLESTACSNNLTNAWTSALDLAETLQTAWNDLQFEVQSIPRASSDVEKYYGEIVRQYVGSNKSELVANIENISDVAGLQRLIHEKLLHLLSSDARFMASFEEEYAARQSLFDGIERHARDQLNVVKPLYYRPAFNPNMSVSVILQKESIITTTKDNSVILFDTGNADSIQSIDIYELGSDHVLV